MSWSVSAKGKPAEVKQALAGQLKNAKSNTAGIPHEQASVEAIEGVVNGQIDFLASLKAEHEIEVSASGSVWYRDKEDGGTSVTLNVRSL